jgi:hypothetical protein
MQNLYKKTPEDMKVEETLLRKKMGSRSVGLGKGHKKGNRGRI